MLTIAQLADCLVKANPAVWGKWDGKPNRRIMVGRTIRAQLKAAKLDIPSGRLETDPQRPTVYRLADIQGALS